MVAAYAVIFCGLAHAGMAGAQDSPLDIAAFGTITLDKRALKQGTELSALSVSPQQDLYITDAGLHRVLRFDAEGNLLREFGGFGWQFDQFDGPASIWAENGLDVFVADYNNDRIQRLDRQLNFVHSIANSADQPERLQFGMPVSAAFSSFGELFIADHGHNRILRIDLASGPVQSFGDFDWGTGTLREPVDLCVGADNEIFVADRARRSILRFDQFGNFLLEIQDDWLEHPFRIAAGASRLFVLDTLKHRLLVYSDSGTFEATIPLLFHSVHPEPEYADIAIAGTQIAILERTASAVLKLSVRSR